MKREADKMNDEEIPKCKKAHVLLLRLLEDRIFISLRKGGTTCKILKSLQTAYEVKGTVKKILMWKRLSTIKKNKDIAMRQHIENT